MNSSIAGFIRNTNEAFGPNDSPAQRWDTANMLIRKLGGTAVNIGAIHIDKAEPKWMLSSMSASWLQQYIEDNLFEIDPFIPMLKIQNTPIVLDTRIHKKSQPLNRHLFRAGYKFLYGMPFQGADLNERKIVTYCTDITFTELTERGYLECIRFLAAILATQVLPLDNTVAPSQQYFFENTLSMREVESLTLLAQGQRNERIAHTLGIAEVTVRKHINAARIKLGAMTREQAVAIALHNRFISLGIVSDI